MDVCPHIIEMSVFAEHFDSCRLTFNLETPVTAELAACPGSALSPAFWDQDSPCTAPCASTITAGITALVFSTDHDST